jgi:hypothetical protein
LRDKDCHYGHAQARPAAQLRFDPSPGQMYDKTINAQLPAGPTRSEQTKMTVSDTLPD